jgi:hypothetical protein
MGVKDTVFCRAKDEKAAKVNILLRDLSRASRDTRLKNPRCQRGADVKCFRSFIHE